MFQQVILLGRVGVDPEIRYSQSGTPIAKFNLATSRKYFDNNSNLITETEWHRITVFGKMVENIISKYVKKGDLIQIAGRLKTSVFEKEGKNFRNTEIIAELITLMPKGKKEEESSNSEEKPKQQKQKKQQKHQEQNQQQDEFYPSSDQEYQSDMMEDNSAPTDDIPF